MENSITKSTTTYDYAGIFLSSLCAVHCLVTPFLLAALPSFGRQFQSPWIHFVLLIFIGVVFMKTILSHYKMHRSNLALGFGIFGLSVLTFGFIREVFFVGGCETVCSSCSHDPAGMYISIAGGLLLITAHIFNLRACVCFRKGEVCGSSA